MAFKWSDVTNFLSDVESSAKNAVEDTLKLFNVSQINSTTNEVEKPTATNNYVEATKSIIDIYGIRQDIVIQNTKEDPKITAFRILNDNCLPKETVEVEVLGDINYKVGYGVHVIFPFLTDYDCFMYIKEVTNEWKSNGVFLSTLTLVKSRVMDEQEWSDIDESDDSTSTGNSNSATASSIIALLKQQIGKPYVWGATGPNSFDCSGLTYYCFNQFQSQLIGGKPIGRTTYMQLTDGEAVDASDSSKWQPGDLVFPHTGHVLTYIGDGKFIAAPKSGDNVKIQTQYWESTYAVRRVIAEAPAINSGDVDLTGATEISMDLSFYTGAEDEGGAMSASGKDLEFGMCASNVYPFGTKFYIKGVSGLSDGVYTVEDTGGTDFNSANRLDIYIGNGHASKVKANNLGRQTVTAYKLKS